MNNLSKRALTAGMLALAAAGLSPAIAQQRSPDERAARQLYSDIIGFRTARGHKQVPAMVAYLKGALIEAGFAESDIAITDYDSDGEPTQGLMVTYRAKGTPKAGPIVLLGHMDVVEALPEDWERPPFTLTEEDGYFFGRGTIDNKYGIASLVHTFIRLRKEGWTPGRDLVLAFSGDEETGMISTRAQAKLVAETIRPALVLNSDAGGIRLSEDFKPIMFGVQAAEKTFATFELTVTNPGGHSSRPRPDNAIYELASALKAIEAYRFPVRDSAITRGSFAELGKITPGPLGEAMLTFAHDPADEAARATLLASPAANMLSTTCVATMLKGGHAENALPQSATATVNCRIFPGEGGAAATEAALKQAIGNDKVAFKLATDVVEAPASTLDAEVLGAVKAGVHPRFPDMVIAPYMEAGGTDGMHYRALGLNTVAISGAAMRDSDMFAHGLNERIRVEDFYAGLDHWYLILKHLAG